MTANSPSSQPPSLPGRGTRDSAGASDWASGASPGSGGVWKNRAGFTAHENWASSVLQKLASLPAWSGVVRGLWACGQLLEISINATQINRLVMMNLRGQTEMMVYLAGTNQLGVAPFREQKVALLR